MKIPQMENGVDAKKTEFAKKGKELAARIAAEFEKPGNVVNFDSTGIGAEVRSLFEAMKDNGYANFESLGLSAEEAHNLDSAHIAWSSL